MKTVAIALTMAALLNITAVYGLPVSDAIARRAVPLDLTIFTREPSANLYDPREFIVSDLGTRGIMDMLRKGREKVFGKANLNPMLPTSDSPLPYDYDTSGKANQPSQNAVAHLPTVQEEEERHRVLQEDLATLKIPVTNKMGMRTDLKAANAHLRLAVAKGQKEGADKALHAACELHDKCGKALKANQLSQTANRLPEDHLQAVVDEENRHTVLQEGLAMLKIPVTNKRGMRAYLRAAKTNLAVARGQKEGADKALRAARALHDKCGKELDGWKSQPRAAST